MSEGQSLLLGQIKNFTHHESAELQIHEMNLLSCTFNTLSLSRELPALKLSRECLNLSDGLV